MEVNGKIQNYPCLRLVIFFAIGIWLGDWTKDVVPICGWGYATILFCVCNLLFFKIKHTLHDVLPIVHTLILFLALVMLGAWDYQLEWRAAHINFSHQPRNYEGVVVSALTPHGKVFMGDVLLTDSIYAGQKIRVSMLTDSQEKSLPMVGDGITFTTNMVASHRVMLSEKFDYATWLMYHGYTGTAFISKYHWRWKPIRAQYLSRWDRAKIVVMIWRKQLIEKTIQIGGLGQEQGLIMAMTLGEQSQLNQSTKDDFAFSGASHVLALSGLHLGIIYALLVVLLGRKERWWKTSITLLSIWLYAMLVGMSPSIVRACLMLSIYTLISLLQRKRFSLNTWAVSLFAILLVHPAGLMDVGLQMSFMAVLSILIYYRPLMHCWTCKYRILRGLWAMICISISTQIGVMPLVAFYFHRISCYFLLTNIVVIPLMTAVLYVMCCSWALLWYPLLAGWGFKIASFLVRIMNTYIQCVAHLPGSTVEHIQLNIGQLLAIYLFLTCISLTIPKLRALKELNNMRVFHKK